MYIKSIQRIATAHLLGGMNDEDIPVDAIAKHEQKGKSKARIPIQFVQRCFSLDQMQAVNHNTQSRTASEVD
jgi:hypothetical protein